MSAALAPPAARLSAIVESLLHRMAAVALLRRIAGPRQILIHARLLQAMQAAAALLGRIAAGTDRRHPHRARPRPASRPRTPPAPSPLPSGPGWLLRLYDHWDVNAAQSQFRHWLQAPDVAPLVASSPQLRRRLRPLGRMLGVRVPEPAAALGQEQPTSADASPSFSLSCLRERGGVRVAGPHRPSSQRPRRQGVAGSAVPSNTCSRHPP